MVIKKKSKNNYFVWLAAKKLKYVNIDTFDRKKLLLKFSNIYSNHVRLYFNTNIKNMAGNSKIILLLDKYKRK